MSFVANYRLCYYCLMINTFRSLGAPNNVNADVKVLSFSFTDAIIFRAPSKRDVYVNVNVESSNKNHQQESSKIKQKSLTNHRTHGIGN